METIKKPTVGEEAFKRLCQPAEPINIIDIQKEADKEFVKELEDLISKNRNFDKKYYIQIILKKEPLMENVIRRYLIPRHTRPIPDFDTSLFSYDNEKEQLYFHWSIPDPTSCHYLLTHETSLPLDEQPLLEMVKKFSAGVLL